MPVSLDHTRISGTKEAETEAQLATRISEARSEFGLPGP
jgi:hypothetical protein